MFHQQEALSYENISLTDYCRSIHENAASPFQAKEDAIKIVSNYVKSRLGSLAARDTSNIMNYGLLSMANHHGVDYFAQSIQGNVLYWKMLKEKRITGNFIPHFSTSFISLRNSSYGRGILCYGEKHVERCPIFPYKIADRTVYHAPPMTGEWVKKAVSRLTRMPISEKTKDTIAFILEEIYLQPSILEQPSYSDQAVGINARMSGYMFPDSDFPQSVYIDMERALGELLLKDLKDENSLLSILLFDKRVRSWFSKQGEKDPFFSMTDDKKRKYPLFIEGDALLGNSLTQECFSIMIERQRLIEECEGGKLFPSIFVMAVLLCFSRGFVWLGGPFMKEYLPKMKLALLNALMEAEGYDRAADCIKTCPCRGYISGPIFALARTTEGGAAPAGSVELIKNGGLSTKEIEELLHISVADGEKCGIVNYYEDIQPSAVFDEEWYQQITKQLSIDYPQQIIGENEWERRKRK